MYRLHFDLNLNVLSQESLGLATDLGSVSAALCCSFVTCASNSLLGFDVMLQDTSCCAPPDSQRLKESANFIH